MISWWWVPVSLGLFVLVLFSVFGLAIFLKGLSTAMAHKREVDRLTKPVKPLTQEDVDRQWDGSGW